VERVDLNTLTLFWAAMMASPESCLCLCLGNTVTMPGTYGAEVLAKVRKGKYTVDDFFAKYGAQLAAPSAEDHPVQWTKGFGNQRHIELKRLGPDQSRDQSGQAVALTKRSQAAEVGHPPSRRSR